MSNSGKYYGSKRELKRADFFKSYSNSDHITEKMLSLIDRKINNVKPKRILDLGTGNGYLIREVLARNPDILKNKVVLVGIDSSPTMIDIAKKVSKNNSIEFKTMDNNDIKYPDNYFDLVIAKAVSNISVQEIYRVLRKDGNFIYKEYGDGKGIYEIMSLMKNRLTHSGDNLTKTMVQVGFSNVEIRKYYIPISRTLDELRAIVDTMRVLPKRVTNNKAHKIIDKFYGDSISKIIHSDPYLIIGIK